MRLFMTLLVTTTLALGCSSNSGSSGKTGSGGSAAGGSSAGGASSGGTGGSAGSATGGSAGSSTGGSAGTDGGLADTYGNFAKGFFTKYCVACHSSTSSDQARDYSSMTDITRDHSVIACGVATTKLAGCASFPPPRQFPIGTGAKPTDPERNRLVAWIQAGMPQ